MSIILNGTTGITTPGITNTGPFVFQGTIELPAGTVTAPSLTTTGDTNTGIYFPAADTIAFTEGGVESARFDSSGNFGIGTTSPNEKLQVNGAIRVSGPVAGNSTGTIIAYDSNNSVLGAWGPDNSTRGTTVFYRAYANGGGGTESARITSAGDVGIGTASPAYKLDVNGGVSINAKSLITASGYFICGSAGFRWNNSTDAFNNVVMNDNGTTGFRNAIGLGLTDLTTVTTSGVGVQFPATQSASSNANTLDDYEEGEWTPTFLVAGSETGVTYLVRSGFYTKVGNVVTIWGGLALTNNGSGTGEVTIGGLPFAAGPINAYQHPGVGSPIIVYKANDYVWNMAVDGGSKMFFRRQDVANADTTATDADFDNDTAMVFTVVYKQN